MAGEPIRANNDRLLLWVFLLQVLISPNFESLIRFTGNRLEFVILDAQVVFTEFDQRKKRAEPTPLNCDPSDRWKDALINENTVKYRKKSIRSQYYPGRQGQNMPNIEKVAGNDGRYCFNYHAAMWDELGLTEDDLLQYARTVGARYSNPVEEPVAVPKAPKTKPKRKMAPKKAIEPKRSKVTFTNAVEERPPARRPSPQDLYSNHVGPDSSLIYPRPLTPMGYMPIPPDVPSTSHASMYEPVYIPQSSDRSNFENITSLLSDSNNYVQDTRSSQYGLVSSATSGQSHENQSIVTHGGSARNDPIIPEATSPGFEDHECPGTPVSPYSQASMDQNVPSLQMPNFNIDSPLSIQEFIENSAIGASPIQVYPSDYTPVPLDSLQQPLSPIPDHVIDLMNEFKLNHPDDIEAFFEEMFKYI